jgi:DNA-binding MurR/RpiR family transcriptional regulator
MKQLKLPSGRADKMTKKDVEKLIEERFASFPPKLQLAARFILDSPTEIAMQSMRSVATAAGVQPLVMLRLARILGFESYQLFRAVYMSWASNPHESLYQRAEALTRRVCVQREQQLLADMLNENMHNLGRTLSGDNAEIFAQAQRAIHKAKHIYILGVRSLFPAAYYLNYVCTMLFDNVTLIAGLGGTFADEARQIDKRDVLIAFNFYPYSTIGVQAIELAHEREATIIGITDSTVSVVARSTEITLLAPNASASLFPSVLPAMAVAEALAALLVSAEKAKGLKKIEEVQDQLRRFNVYVDR